MSVSERELVAAAAAGDPAAFASLVERNRARVAAVVRRLALQRRVAVGGAGVAVEEDRELLRAVQDAVDLLPAGQRDVVLMHYVDDLACEEIARLLDTTPGAVRVRLHRARAQLRRELAPLAPVRLRTKEETMMEARVEDVLVRVAPDDATRAVDDG